ncbi:Protein CobW [Candidatus Terasakiella magnetica]|uniref:Protein CobW n=1 Tax=Candidatus Terasakiella magnetica TaxID=1867952 RepID=A0A1C3RE73_9PROT|nr:cobalamin biosynthesis protein CobW [Candidatus Terasakiella magnetica]SCA55596.1 Protein CobW [Candidatus Terasakiella magnetica]
MKIPATVITGFLGAGKTTLIRHMLENAGGKRIALVINEFGDLGVDREMVKGCGIEGCEDENGDDNVIELANGCICCTVADEFLPTMEALLERETPPDHIVIETSGLALPKPLVKAFNWPEIKTRVTVDGVVTVIDTHAVEMGRFADDEATIQKVRESDENLDHDNPLEELFEDQLQCADMVLMNKSDLVEEARFATIQSDLKSRVRDHVKFIKTDHGQVDPAILLGLDAAAEDDLAGRDSHHEHGHDHDHEHDHHHEHDHSHDEFESFSLSLGPINDPVALESKLLEVVDTHDILRVKGFLDIPGKPMRHVVQGVGPRFQRYFDRPWAQDEARSSQLVIIGKHGLDRAAIEKSLVA